MKQEPGTELFSNHDTTTRPERLWNKGLSPCLSKSQFQGLPMLMYLSQRITLCQFKGKRRTIFLFRTKLTFLASKWDEGARRRRRSSLRLFLSTTCMQTQRN